MLALMLAFLHDHALAATPWNIVVAMFRLRGSYILLCLFVAAALAVAAGTFAVALLFAAESLQDLHASVALVAGVVQWTSIVVMRILGPSTTTTERPCGGIASARGGALPGGFD